MVTINDIIEATNLHKSRILNVYIFGSQVYGTANKGSDIDIIVIAKTHNSELELSYKNLNIHIMTVERFQNGLDQHNIRNIECIMAPEWAILKEQHKFRFNLNLSRLRHSISHISSNSWVKCNKKIQSGEYYTGLKSLWHSIRIPVFATQIIKYRQINDWTCMNDFWKNLNSKRWTWSELNDDFRNLRNEKMTEFRRYTSK